VARFRGLRQTLNKLFSPTLEKALTFLDDSLLPATSNAVERGNPSCLRRVSGRAGLAAAQVTDRPDAVGQAFSHCRATPLPAVIGLTNP